MSGNITGDTAQKILLDVGLETPPHKSRLHYGAEELEFRAGVEERLANFRQQHPDSAVEIRE